MTNICLHRGQEADFSSPGSSSCPYCCRQTRQNVWIHERTLVSLNSSLHIGHSNISLILSDNVTSSSRIDAVLSIALCKYRQYRQLICVEEFAFVSTEHLS